MRPDVTPKFIRVKDEPEIASTRTFGGVGTVLYSGAVSNEYSTGDSGFSVASIAFTGLDADYLVRVSYTANGYFTETASLRFALDLDAGAPVAGVSAYSNFSVDYFGWEFNTAPTLFISGTAIVPAGDHTISPWWDTVLNTDGLAVGNQDPETIRESWSVDIIDKASNDAFSVNYSGQFFGSGKSLGESFQWVTFLQAGG